MIAIYKGQCRGVWMFRIKRFIYSTVFRSHTDENRGLSEIKKRKLYTCNLSLPPTKHTRKPAIANRSRARWCSRSKWPWTTETYCKYNETLESNRFKI